MHLLGNRDLARLARAAGMTRFQIRATRVLGMPMVWALVFWKSTETRKLTRPHCAPRPESTAGKVFKRILRSSQRDQLSM